MAAPSSRRQFLISGVVAAVALTGCGTNPPAAQTGGSAPPGPVPDDTTRGATTGPSAPGTSAPATCALTPELTAGPYYIDAPALRRDITEGRPGVPLTVQLRVLDVASCQPVAGAAVDLWHCDANGEYSGFNGNSLAATNAGGTNTKRYLRGVQVTDDNGAVTFTTIFPGWYEGRTVHIHLKVIAGGTADATYHGGHVAHTGQLFFAEPPTAQVMVLDPYRAHAGTRTTNAQDSIYQQAGPAAIAELTAVSGGDPAAGFTAELTCTVDPNATPPPAPMF